MRHQRATPSLNRVVSHPCDAGRVRVRRSVRTRFVGACRTVVCGVVCGIVVSGVAACGQQSDPPGPHSTSPAAGGTQRPDTDGTAAPATPSWRVGAHPLPRREDGLGEIRPTPPELVNRRLPTVDRLPPPADGRYTASVRPVPDRVLARSTWRPGCPVARTELRYLTMSFWGFDGRAHTGEMLVHARAARPITRVFARLFAVRFPIEEMRVVGAAELDAAPTGDGNNTTAFVCRPARGQTSWSAHASGLAVDVNPFCNPYTTGSIVLPERASSYLDRQRVRPGMILPADATVHAFAGIGWSWGGEWRGPRDLMHFSATGK